MHFHTAFLIALLVAAIVFTLDLVFKFHLALLGILLLALAAGIFFLGTLWPQRH